VIDKHDSRLVGGGLALGLALLVLYPGWLTAGSRLIGDEGLDVWSHAWGIRWVFSNLMDGQLPWAVDGLTWPRGGTLWYIDPLGALASIPAQLLSGPILGHNSILFGQVMLAGWAAYGFARALGGRGIVAAVMLGTAPTFLAEIHNGTVEACWIGLVPLAGWAAAKNRWWAGAFVGLAGLATPYHGIAAASVVGTTLLFRPHESNPPPWKTRIIELGMAAGLALLIAGPGFLALKASLDDPMGIAKKSTIILNYPVFRINAVDPIALFHMGDFWTVQLDGPGTTPFRRTPYLGLVGLLLAGVVWVRRPSLRWWLLPVGGTVSLALGPFLWHDDDFVRTASGDLIALPFRALLGMGVVMDHPLRFISGAVSVIAVLADVASRQLEDRVPVPVTAWTVGLAALVGIEQLSLAPNVWPIATSDGEVPDVYEQLEGPGAIIDLPAARGQSIATNRYLYWQGMHEHPIPYSHKVGPDLPTMNAALRTWADLSRDMPRTANDPGRISDNEDLGLAVSKLVRSNFKWVVLHPELLLDEPTALKHRTALQSQLGAPQEIDGTLVWTLGSDGP